MAKAVETFTKISAPDLLNTAHSLYGWIKKENDSTGLLSVVKVFDGWPWYFMIMRTGCLYLFKKPESATFSEAIPLTKYRVCDATDVTKYPWVFKLIHSTEVKTLFFSVDTEFDLKNWKDAIIKEKEEYCSDDSGHSYCCIDEHSSDPSVFEEPPPPAPKSRRLPKQPAARPLPPVPMHPGRQHSLSLPPDLSPYDNAPPPPLKQHSPHSPSSPTKKKPATLPRDRPLPEPPDKSRREPEPLPSKKENLRRTSSESCLGTKPTTAFNSVVKQFENTRLSHIHEGATAPLPMKPPPRSGAGWTPSKPNTHARCPPDGCESARGKHSEQVSPTWDQSPQDAFQNDMSKDSASRTLKLEQLGTFLTRPGNSESGKSLSMRDKNEEGKALIRHYRIFYNQVHGYALHDKGPWFDSISQMLKHYYQNQLPNTKGKLRYPYQL